MSRKNYSPDRNKVCNYCGLGGLWWVKSQGLNGKVKWILFGAEGFHRCLKPSDLGPKQPEYFVSHQYDDIGNRVYEDIGYTPLPHPETHPEEKTQAQKEYEDWAALQAHLKKILD